MTKMEAVAELGQSVWLDFIRRSYIRSGDLQALIDQGLRGVTSNPSIFKQAIAGSTDYDSALHELVDLGKSVDEIYESLVIEDIQMACDALRGVYDSTGGLDGYVSLEVRPNLAHDTQGTLAEVRHYFQTVDRPNLMIKIPATPEGMPAIQQSISEGINVNVTLMFSLRQLEQVAEAYISGLEKLKADGGDVSSTASVSSFFVSRLDSKLDPLLEERGEHDLLGTIGIANAKLAYELFQRTFSGKRWDELAASGARVQRVLWGSTSTKNPNYPDTLYVDNLIGPHTVNTIPPSTLEAFLDHGKVERTIDEDLETARGQVARLEAAGVDLDEVTDQLLKEGVQSFEDAFNALMQSIEEKREKLLSGWQHQEVSAGESTKK